MATHERAPASAPGWPYTEHSRMIERGRLRWHVQIMGNGPPLLLVHGTGASSHSFRALMPMLAKRFTLIAPDLPGHAFTTAPASFEPSLPTIAAALEDLLDALGMKPEIAVGHSAGAALIARMTLDGGLHPRLLVGLGAALVPFRGLARKVFPSTARFLSMAAPLIAKRVGTTESVERLLRSTGSTLDRSGVELYRRLSERPEHVAAVLSMMAHWNLEPLYAHVPNLTVPFLLIGGAHDRAVSIAQQRALAAHVPSARLIVLPGAGHLLHEEQPDEVASIVLDEADAVAATRDRVSVRAN